MSKTTSKMFLRKGNVLVTFFVLCSLFISANAFSLEYWQWNPKSIRTNYLKISNKLELSFIFTGYGIGPYNEHGYVERCEFQYSTDGESYKTLGKYEVKDQIGDAMLWVNLTYKEKGAKINILGCEHPQNGSSWDDLPNTWVGVKVYFNGKTYSSFLTLLWQVPVNVKIKKIRAKGKWIMKGLYNPDNFDEIYDLTKSSTPSKSMLKSDQDTNSKQIHENATVVSPTKNKDLKVFSNTNAIVIQGADRGEKINIITISGTQVKSIIANDDVMNVQLPTKQSYFVNIGESRYRVSL